MTFADPVSRNCPGWRFRSMAAFDHGKDFRNVLHFIQRDWHVQSGNESVGVALGCRQNAGIIEGEVLAVLSRQFR
ncbi:MAG: hypothetical protein ABR987_18085 [Terracidiphilus sp.]|jgi:hypothetical protein